MAMFKVRPRLGKEDKPLVGWMRIGVHYDVLAVNTFKPDKDAGMETWFLIGDDSTGQLAWVKSLAVDYVKG